MRISTILLPALMLGMSTQAQTVATFDSLTLPGANTYYVNYTAPGVDVGFNSGLAHFPCLYDTAWGGVWSAGFAYSNMTDSVTSGFTNQYAAKTAKGYGGSNNYAAVNCIDPSSYQYNTGMQLIGSARGKKVNGFFVTNSTYAYNSMLHGDAIGKKFGGVTGTDPDWFKLTVKGFLAGTEKTDSVNFYLADFRPVGTVNDYIIKTWTWVNLLPLGNVDSVHFYLTSSDNGSFGMNTPAYFCIDNFITYESETPINLVAGIDASTARIYPNPARQILVVDVVDRQYTSITVMDAAGRILMTSACEEHNVLRIEDLPVGSYFLSLSGAQATVAGRFEKL